MKFYLITNPISGKRLLFPMLLDSEKAMNMMLDRYEFLQKEEVELYRSKIVVAPVDPEKALGIEQR